MRVEKFKNLLKQTMSDSYDLKAAAENNLSGRYCQDLQRHFNQKIQL